MRKIDKAFSSLPFIANQRGLSGMNVAMMQNTAAGKAAAQNIHLQAICPFHEAAMSAELNEEGIGSAINQLVICAAKMPSTMVSWFKETNFPLMEVGATSAIYIGESPEAMPIPMPPKNLATRKTGKVLATPVAMAEKKKINADTINSFFRPILSARLPHTMAPIRQPMRAIVMARPCCEGLSAIW